MNSLRPHIFAGLVSLAAPMAFAQGVPTFDAGMFLQRERVLQQGEQDLALQRERLTKEEELEELEQSAGRHPRCRDACQRKFRRTGRELGSWCIA